jgi:hypothetical protein
MRPITLVGGHPLWKNSWLWVQVFSPYPIGAEAYTVMYVDRRSQGAGDYHFGNQVTGGEFSLVKQFASLGKGPLVGRSKVRVEIGP